MREGVIAKAKWFSGSLPTMELHSLSSFSLIAKRSRSFSKELAWVIKLSSSIRAILALVDFCCQPSPCCSAVLHHGCNHFLCGIELLVCVCVPCVVAFCKETACRLSPLMSNTLNREKGTLPREYTALLN